MYLEGKLGVMVLIDIFPLIEKDRLLLKSISTSIKAVWDQFIQQQVHTIIRYVLESMVRATFIDIFHHGPVVIEPIIILNRPDLSGEIGKEPIEFRRNVYIMTILSTALDRLDPYCLR